MTNKVKLNKKELKSIVKGIANVISYNRSGMELNIPIDKIEENSTDLIKLLENFIRTEEFIKAIRPIEELSDKYNALNNLRFSLVRAVDVYEKAFIIRKQDFKYIEQNLDTIIKASKANNAPIEDGLLYSNIRFCAIHNSLNGAFKEYESAIIDMPTNIFKFLIDNDYSEEILLCIHNDTFGISYDYIGAFKKLLRVGKNFATKKQLLGEADMRLLKSIKKIYNPVDESIINLRFMHKFGNDKYMTLLNYCGKLNIHLKTLIYRLACQDMDSDKAIDIGAKESEQYGVGFVRDDNLINQNEIFFNVAREYMKELGYE